MKPSHSPLVLTLIVILGGSTLGAQTFSSGSNGSDGALDLTGRTGTILFDPASFNPPLDPDHDNVYHFTTIKIPSGLTVRLAAEVLGMRPVVWLASGDVRSDGTLDLSGENGHSSESATIPNKGGVGGYPGGVGETSTSPWEPGQGPGGARGAGGGAGYVIAGTGAAAGLNGLPYGNDFLIPLVGGSGGSGGRVSNGKGSGGGAGGGAILIASSTFIHLSGRINTDGGNGGFAGVASRNGGGGSGGSIRLIAPVIEGSATLSANGGFGCCGTGQGSYGRIRLEAFQHRFTGQSNPNPMLAVPGPVFPPLTTPSVRIATIGGIAVPTNPTGSFLTPDVTVDTTAPVTIQLEASRVPIGTVVHLTMVPETGAIQLVDSTPLAGTFESSSATATVTLPPRFTRFSVQASWTP